MLDPTQSINGGAKYLKQQLDAFGGDTVKALAAYNAGPGAVQRFGGIPPYAETQNYVRIVQANAAAYRTGHHHTVPLRHRRSLRDLRLMTTDRTAAPTRSLALADRPSSTGRSQAPPSDAFAALLGAAAPKSGDAAQVRRDDAAARRNDASDGRNDVATRRDEVSNRRDDASHRRDRAHRADRREQQQDHADAPRVTDKPVDEVAAPEATEATETATDPAAVETTPATPTTPSLFSMQLASPLPPATPAPAPAAAAEMTAETAKLPTFAGQIPASVAAATTAQAAAATTAATAAATAETAVANAPAATDAKATTGAIALAGLPAEATADTAVPAGLDLSKATADAAATPAEDGVVPAEGRDVPQQQTGGDASGQEQPTTPNRPPRPPRAPPPPHPRRRRSTRLPPRLRSPPRPHRRSRRRLLPAGHHPERRTRRAAQPRRRFDRAADPMASDRGITHARLNLKPVELGGIEVRLRTSPQGVHAQLVADSPEAARMLSSAGEDLRKSLEDRNVTCCRSTSRRPAARTPTSPPQFTDAFGESYQPGGTSSRRGANDERDLMDSPALAETTLVLPDGVHVDVFA